jgi:hypothetical protein
MAVDLFFQRVENAQPRIRRKARSRNRHNKFSRGGGQIQRPYLKIIAVNLRSFSIDIQQSSLARGAVTLGFKKISLSWSVRHTSTKNFCLRETSPGLFLCCTIQNLQKPSVKYSSYNCRVIGAEPARCAGSDGTVEAVFGICILSRCPTIAGQNSCPYRSKVNAACEGTRHTTGAVCRVEVAHLYF